MIKTGTSSESNLSAQGLNVA